MFYIAPLRVGGGTRFKLLEAMGDAARHCEHHAGLRGIRRDERA